MHECVRWGARLWGRHLRQRDVHGSGAKRTPQSPLPSDACVAEPLLLLRRLVALGCRRAQASVAGVTPLHLAAQAGVASMVRVLLLQDQPTLRFAAMYRRRFSKAGPRLQQQSTTVASRVAAQDEAARLLADGDAPASRQGTPSINAKLQA